MKVKLIISAMLLSLAMLVAMPAFAGGKIDINSASTKQLAAIKGIGPKLSQAIVSYRDAHGAFHNVDELIQVRGIGKKSLERIRGQLVADAPENKKE